MEYQKPKLIGEDPDGLYLGMVEEIYKNKNYDTLLISNRNPFAWIFSIFTGYRQIGRYKVPINTFKEGDFIIVEKRFGDIISVKKED